MKHAYDPANTYEFYVILVVKYQLIYHKFQKNIWAIVFFLFMTCQYILYTLNSRSWKNKAEAEVQMFNESTNISQSWHFTLKSMHDMEMLYASLTHFDGIDQTVELTMICNSIMLMWCHYNGTYKIMLLLGRINAWNE